jgi:hypothetical protein
VVFREAREESRATTDLRLISGGTNGAADPGRPPAGERARSQPSRSARSSSLILRQIMRSYMAWSVQ